MSTSAVLADHEVTQDSEGELVSLDFELSEDQTMIRDEVRRYAEERIAPGTAERDRDHEFPQEIIQELGELGLLGMMVDEKHGGAGLDPVTYCLAVEELSRICPATAVTMSVSNSVACWPIDHFGNEELKSTVLQELASGECIGGFGLTEPGSGSDAASMRTTAVRDGDHWVLQGEKAWITNAGFARYYVVLAKTDPDAGKRGITAFVVPADAEGFSVGTPEEKLGLRASRTAPIYFEQVRIPASWMLGELGKGLNLALATLDHSRLGIAAQAMGEHRRALELAISYAKEREQFGRPIADFQAIRFQLAEIAVELEAARTLTLYAASLPHGHKDAGRLASEAKVYASEAANRAVWKSLQIHGGNGYCEDYEIARLYRDVRVTTIYEGTSEMQRLVISRHVLNG
ncbi:MAG: acyl-CoA dehydrogenase family protein [Acidobacteriota bacterium]